MTPGPFRVLLVATHPVQYGAPLFRSLAKESRDWIFRWPIAIWGEQKRIPTAISAFR